jgi:ribosomal protein S18 acetylase RimI-like enzyme
LLQIIQATTDEHIRAAKQLSAEYITWIIEAIRETYPELDIEQFIGEHDYDESGAKFPGEYVPPFGRLLVALNDNLVCGCIALGKLSESICEMRTLFVPPAYRGQGIGRKLAETLLDEARAVGYSVVRLDTLRFMDSAFGLYRSLGFREIDSYRALPDHLKPYIRFMERDLSR